MNALILKVLEHLVRLAAVTLGSGGLVVSNVLRPSSYFSTLGLRLTPPCPLVVLGLAASAALSRLRRPRDRTWMLLPLARARRRITAVVISCP